MTLTGPVVDNFSIQVQTDGRRRDPIPRSINTPTNVIGGQPTNNADGAPLAPQFQFVTTRQHGRGKMVVMYNNAPFTHVVTGTDLSTSALSFVFEETGGIAQGSKFEIDIPAGWSNPFKPIDPQSTADGAVNGADLSGPNLRTVAGDLNNSAGDAYLPSGERAGSWSLYLRGKRKCGSSS